MGAAAADASQRERGDDVAHALSPEGSGLPVTARYCLAQSPAGGTSRLAPRHLPTCKRDQLRCVDEVRSHQPARPRDQRCNFCHDIAGALALPGLCCHPRWRRHERLVCGPWLSASSGGFSYVPTFCLPASSGGFSYVTALYDHCNSASNLARKYIVLFVHSSTVSYHSHFNGSLSPCTCSRAGMSSGESM